MFLLPQPILLAGSVPETRAWSTHLTISENIQVRTKCEWCDCILTTSSYVRTNISANVHLALNLCRAVHSCWHRCSHANLSIGNKLRQVNLLFAHWIVHECSCLLSFRWKRRLVWKTKFSDGTSDCGAFDVSRLFLHAICIRFPSCQQF